MNKSSIFSFLFCLAAVSLASAQVITASLRGKVSDPNGAMLPNAKITATQKETNFSKSVVAGSLGEYYVATLPAGKYQVVAEAAGFAKVAREIELTVGQEASIDFKLAVGPVSEQVQVSDIGEVVETTKADIGETVRKDQIDNLPTINRDFASLALLAPGVSQGVGGNGPSLAINGQRGYQNNVFIDGVSNLWQYYGRQASTLSQDWIQEFQVMTNSYSAEFGSASGGILNVVTRSGTNNWHGRGYFFHRRKAFDATPFAGSFTNNDPTKPEFLSSSEVPDYTQWRWGASIGGPIIKDKLFIFAGYENLDLASSASLAISPYWRQQGYQTVLPISTTDHPFLIRGDYNINQANHLSLRYDRTILKNHNEGGPFQVQTGRDTFGGPVWNIVANLTTTVTNNSFNDFRFGYMSNMPPIVCNLSGTGGLGELQKGPPGTFANINYPTLITGCPIFDGTEGEQNQKLSDSFAFIRGRHQVKIGVDLRRNVLNDNITNFHEGYWAFEQDLAFNKSDPATYPFEFVGNSGLGNFKIPVLNYGLFVQDTWKVTNNFTVDIGVRYDVDRSQAAGNQYVNFKNQEVVAQYGGSPPLEKTHVDYNNIAPRLGLIWAPGSDRRTKIHAAAGYFYDQNHGNFNAIYIINTLLSNGLTVVNANSPISNPFWDPSNPAAGIAKAKAAMAANFPFFPDFSGIAAPSQGLNTLDPRLQVPFTLQFTAGVEHEFSNGLVASADFVHSRGSGLEYINQDQTLLPDGSVINLDPRFSAVSALTNVGFTHYNALETQIRYQRSRYNLALSYTLAKAVSNLVDGSIFGSSPTNPFDLNQDRGPDDTDQRHSLVINGAYDLPLGFQVAGIGTYRSPVPWSVVTNLNPTGVAYPLRPEPKNSRRGDDDRDVDLRVSKVFRAKERLQVRLFWEMYNLFNSVNFTSYDNLKESTTFSLPTAAQDRRRQQLGVRVDF